MVAWNAAEQLPRARFVKMTLLKKEILSKKFQLMKLQEVFVKKIKTIYFGLFIVMFASCSRCEECQLQGNSETICETEFDNPDQYEDAISEEEILGATCTSTGGF